MVHADIRDATIQNTMVNPNGWKNWPDNPLTSPKGRNTTQVVIVPPSIDAAT